MSKGVKLLIALGAVVIALGAYFLIQSGIFEKEVEAPQYESTVERLTDVEEENVARILIDNPQGRLTIVPTGEDDDFTIEEAGSIELTLKEVGYTVDNLINLFANRTIEENPEDSSVYGFDDPIMQVRILEKDDTVTMINVGSTTPDKGGYYVSIHPESTVYVVSDYYLRRAFNTVNDYRPKEMPQINLSELAYLKVVNAQTVEITPMTEEDRDVRGATYAAFKIVQPYNSPKEMDSTYLETLYPDYVMTPRILEFIADNPSDLAPYGLDSGRTEIQVMDQANELHLYLGDTLDDGSVYAMYPGETSVFTIPSDAVAIKDLNAFDITSKNIMLVNIDACDNFSVEVADGRRFNAAITREPDPEDPEETLDTYMINGIPIDEKPFKKFYQKVIGISAHAINPAPETTADDPYIRVTYFLNTEEGATAEIQILEYDRYFYAIYAFGESTFLTAREEIDQLISSAEELLSGE